MSAIVVDRRLEARGSPDPSAVDDGVRYAIRRCRGTASKVPDGRGLRGRAKCRHCYRIVPVTAARRYVLHFASFPTGEK